MSDWLIEDHVCRACFGRVLSRTGEGGVRVYRCSNCGAERSGSRVSLLCACGIKLRGVVDAGLRCRENTSPKPECMSQIVVEQTESWKGHSASMAESD